MRATRYAIYFEDIRTRLSFSVQSCEACVWIEHENTQVVQTAWAAMALMYGEYPITGPIVKAVKLVMSRQLPVCDLVPLSVSESPS